LFQPLEEKDHRSDEEIEDNYSDAVDDFEDHHSEQNMNNIKKEKKVSKGTDELKPLSQSKQFEQNFKDSDDEKVDEDTPKVSKHREQPAVLSKEDKPHKSHSQKAHSEKDFEESEIGEEEGLEIAEKCFSKIADKMKAKSTTVINHFKDYIASQVTTLEDGKEYEIVFIPPANFLEGLQTLELELTDIEIR
jgi:hypothetical protein